jgi:hypothetical protein
VLLLVVSETGLVYTFTTPKLQPLVTKPEGKNLIQVCRAHHTPVALPYLRYAGLPERARAVKRRRERRRRRQLCRVT